MPVATHTLLLGVGTALAAFAMAYRLIADCDIRVPSDYTFYRRFYFRPRKIAELTAEMMTRWDLTKRRLREGSEFFRFLRMREA